MKGCLRGPAARLAACLGLLAPAAGGPAWCQEPPPELRRDVFRVDTEVVLLDVVVRDKKGRSVRDLRPDEIEVYEDGVRQQVGSFRFLDSRAIGEALEDAQSARLPARPRRGRRRRRSPARAVT